MLHRLERFIDTFNHTLELVRTLVPIAVLILQMVILVKMGSLG